MRKIREVLRLRGEHSLSHRQIAASCQVGVGTVQDYLRRAKAASLSWPLPDTLDDAKLEAALFPPASPAPPEGRPLPDWTVVHRELRRKGVTLVLLWEEYRAANPQGLGYSQFCQRFADFQKALPAPTMRQVHKAGEKLFVDYAGQTVPLLDRKTGEKQEAQIFVATLGASSYTYAEATLSQSLPDWIGAHVRAFAFFGGVPQQLVPDNLKAGVTAANYYDPDLNPTYQEMAHHYGCVILPTRVRKPRDKAKVENGVQQVERRLLAPLRNQTFFSLAELNSQLRRLLEELNDRPGQGLPGTRRELFDAVEAAALQPLPAIPYEFALWKKARVHLDYHIDVERHFYSVPSRLLKQEVEVRLTATMLEVFFGGERVASHARSFRRYAYTTLTQHMPPGHRALLERTPERLLEQAKEMGSCVEETLRHILASRPHPEQGYRACLGVLRLGKVHGKERLQAACQRALATGATSTLSYKTLQNILQQRLEQTPLPTPTEETVPETTSLHHDNIRGACYYSAAPSKDNKETTP